MKKSNWNMWSVTSWPISVGCMLFGLALLLWPSISNRIVGYALAAVLCVIGGVNIVMYFREDKYLVMMRSNLASGLALLTAGVVLLFVPELPGSILPFLWGAVLVFGGFTKLQMMLDMRRMEAGKWWWLAIGAGLSLGLGVVALANPFGVAIALTRFIGAALLTEGVLDAVSMIVVNRTRKRFYPGRE